MAPVSMERRTASTTRRLCNVSATVAGADTPKAALRQAIHAYASIRYDMEDATNESPVCVGLIAAPAAVLARARQVNDAKASLKALCAPLRLRQGRVPVRGGSIKTEKISVVRAGLRSLQASDVNLMAAYRKIQILEVPPEVVQYSRARTRSVYRLSIEEVEELLALKEGAIATADRARLARLPRDITHLAMVSDHVAVGGALVAGARIDWAYREQPRAEQDSGWRVFAGDETAEHTADAANIGLVPLRDLLPIDGDLEDLFALEAPVQIERGPDGRLHPLPPS